MIARSRERGATLLVALVVLVLLTILGLSAFTTSSMNLQTTNNTQSRNEAQNAAQLAIDTAISTAQFVSTPASVFAQPCGSANTLCVDRNGDGTSDYTVRLTPPPTCRKAETIKLVTLDLTKADELACATGQNQQFGVAGIDTAAGDSLCSNTVWDITAEATAAVGGAKVVLAQGIGIRVQRDSLYASCLP